MPIRSSAVGAELEAQQNLVSVRRTLAYAAGIGDTGGRTFDDASEDNGLVASPSFCVSLEWAVVIAGRSTSVLGASAEELRRGVHAAQDSFFHRPIRPGDDLETRGRVVALRSTRAGTLGLTKLETVDRANGDVVVTSWSTSIYRSVGLDGEATALEEAPSIPAMGGSDDLEKIEIPIAKEMPHIYTECARIWNPIHTERVVALAAGLPDVILHGTATWALAGREVVRRRCDGDPTRLRRLHGRFRAMVIPGYPITVELGSRIENRVRFRVRNHLGEEAISDGLAEIQ